MGSHKPFGQRPPADMLEHNLKLLQGRLRNRISEIDMEAVWRRYEVILSADGCPVCRIRTGDSAMQLTSGHPIRQAEQWCEGIPLDHIGTLFVFGCGFGYPLLELQRRKAASTMVVVFEPNVELFAAMLHYFDMEPLLESRQAAFYVGPFEEIEEELQLLFSSVLFLYCTAPAVAFAPSSRFARADCVMLQRKVFEMLSVQTNCYGNSHIDSLIGFRQLIDNMDVVAKSPYLSALRDKYRNVPAFIIANGPSLDKNVRELKQAKGKALILCCESAIKPLLQNGIVPDAIVVLERDPEVYLYHFKDNRYPEEMALLALSLVDPRVFESFAGPKLPIFRSQETSSKWMNSIVGDGSGLFAGTSVAHLAFEAAIYMGANPIVLVGQDLAYGTDGETHSRQSIYAEERLKDTVAAIRARPDTLVEGNDGKPVRTNSLWIHFRQVLEQIIRKHPGLKVVNATEGGARIEGTACMSLAQAIGAFCRTELPQALHAFIAAQTHVIDPDERKSKIRGLAKSLGVYVSVYRALAVMAAERRDETARLLEQSEQDDAAAVLPRLRKGFQQGFDGMKTFLRSDLHLLFFQQVMFVAYHGLNEIGGKPTPAKIKRGLQIQYELFDQLHVICQSLVRNFQISVERLTAMGYRADADRPMDG